jgi:hypothetical protein
MSFKSTVQAIEKQVYVVVQGFWHLGIWRVPGEIIHAVEAEAKYLLDNLRPHKPAQPVAPAPATPAAAAGDAAGAGTSSAPTVPSTSQG